MKLFLQALYKIIAGILSVGILIFVPAGTLYYWNGWLLMTVLFVPMLLAGIVLLRKKPELLRKRLQMKETQEEQITIVKLTGLLFVVGFLIAGLDYRFCWNPLPKAVSLVAAGVFLLGYLLYAWVLQNNDYLSRTVEIQEHQQVVDTGPYCIVRHPMYAATVFMFLTVPMILGSLFSLLVFCVYPFFIAKRIQQEEQLLASELKGYSDYQKKVRYKLIPFVW